MSEMIGIPLWKIAMMKTREFNIIQFIQKCVNGLWDEWNNNDINFYPSTEW
jgi:hypothetical protein